MTSATPASIVSFALWPVLGLVVLLGCGGEAEPVVTSSGSGAGAAAGAQGGGEGQDPLADLPQLELDELERSLRVLLTERMDAVRATPEHGAAWGALAQALDVHEFIDEALVCYARAEALDPGDFRWPYLAGILLATNAQARALEAFDRAQENKSDYAPLLVRRGIGRTVLGDLEGARADLERSIELNANIVAAYLALARVELAEDNMNGAMIALDKALQLGPQTDEIHGLYAEAHGRLGNEDSAQRAAERVGDGAVREPVRCEIRRAVFAQGVTSTWTTQQALAALRRGDGQKALELWNTALARDPESPMAHIGVAQIMRELNMEGFEQELFEARRLLEAEGEAADPEALAAVALDLGAWHLARNRLEEAEVEFRKALEHDPEFLLVNVNLATIAHENGRTDEALNLLRDAAEALPDDSRVFMNLGSMLVETKQWIEARDVLDRALELAPEQVRPRFERGEARAALGDLEGAIEDFTQVIKNERTLEPAHVNRGRALVKVGRHIEATAMLKKAIRDIPESLKLKQQLAWQLSIAPELAARDGQLALELVNEVIEKRGVNPELLEVLAAANAEAGNFEEAVARQLAAIEGLEALPAGVPPNRDEVRAKMDERLARYRDGKPWRD